MRNNTPTLLMIMGLPGTGKSTLAAVCADAMQWPHLNTDIIREELNVTGQYDDKTKNKVYSELMRRVEALLEAGDSVIVDGTFYKKFHRERFRNLANKVGVDIKWLWLRAAEARVRERVSKKRAHSEADFEVYLKVKAQFEAPVGTFLELWSDRNNLEDMKELVLEYLEK